MYKYFGDVALTRQLRVSDLNDDEIKFLKNDGVIQVLHSRDSAGRRVLVRFLSFAHQFNASLMRPTIYLVYSVLPEDVMAQKNGWKFFHIFTRISY